MAERQFKIKVGTLRRVKKDLEYYVNDHATQQAKIEKMRAEGKDTHDIRKQEEVLVETETMLPDCQSRLKEAITDLSNFIEAHRDEVEPLETFQEAQELLATINTPL
ncbi:tubulin-specific chaperone a [Plasmopara halstedii]|uniref:Tubulin-specific chaperone A n=1 Tax=Plasmopara halstedii TaxID=4781 RepID=A0A0N7L4D3_PLAHL|nr:tubulin-specific chaperone a [Plasmopara halstedii]CEG38355.1 tubulin-specific chaperone a [Plasmopara halstedii]|eukprot:XP_024574724.1 tubulin-specific chaperone a [Plasmopara halstedii]